jgi:hypothetical protein
MRTRAITRRHTDENALYGFHPIGGVLANPLFNPRHNWKEVIDAANKAERRRIVA